MDSTEQAQPLTATRVGAVDWQATPEGQMVLDALGERAGDPAAAGLTRVKANPLRQVFRVQVDTPDGPRECFVKRYEESSLSARLKRLVRGPAARVEWRNTRAARAGGVDVPPPLAVGVAADFSVLLTASCRPACDLDMHLLAAGWSDEVALPLARLLVQAHARGVFHRDLHAGNVLFRAADADRPPAAWLLDLHKARVNVRPLPRRVIANLAPLAAGLRGWANAAEIHDFLAIYHRLARRKHALADVASINVEVFINDVDRLAHSHARGLLRSRDRAIGRPGRYFARLRLSGGWRGGAFLQHRRRRRAQADSPAGQALFTREDWREALADPRALLDESAAGATVIKKSATSLVIRRPLRVGGQTLDVFIKHYPWRRRLAALADPFRRSRAARTFRAGHQLLARDVPTALPLAWLERRVGRWLVGSIVITEAVADSVHLERFVNGRLPKLPPQTRTRLRQSLACRLGEAIAAMHRGGWVHRDMKAPNVLVQVQGDAARVTFVDLDGLKRGRLGRLRPLVRLNAGLWDAPELTRTDRLRVLKHALPECRDWRRAWRRIARASRRRRRARGL